MYRTIMNGKEIIIKLSTKLGKEITTDRTPIYEAVLSIADRVLTRKDQMTFAVNHKHIGLIIGEVQRGEVIVFSVEHIIDKVNIFQEHTFRQSFEEGMNC
ncbi:hypothetical protein ACFDTO_15690 [Microbacteriaceae bacterium 4G12]